jgi:hypothetical protein
MCAPRLVERSTLEVILMRTLSRPRVALFAIAAATAVIVAGCAGSTATPSTQVGAEGAFCEDLTALGDSVEAFIALDPTTASVEDVQAARDAIGDARATVQTSGADIADADQAALEAAWTALDQAVSNIPTDVPISDALGPVQVAAEDVRAANQEIRDGVNCP